MIVKIHPGVGRRNSLKLIKIMTDKEILAKLHTAYSLQSEYSIISAHKLLLFIQPKFFMDYRVIYILSMYIVIKLYILH